jgi:hypothetical protein
MQAAVPCPPSIDLSFPVLHTQFLALLPHIEHYGSYHLRHVRCPHRKEEALQEMRGLAWVWLLRLASQGKDPTAFPTVFAAFAARRVRSDRLVCGREKAKDVLSPRARRLHGFGVEELYEEALSDNTCTPPPDQVAFRCDFAAWRKTRTARDQNIMDDLMVGERPGHVANKYGVSRARISQLRREFAADWERFCTDDAQEQRECLAT